MNPSDKLSVRAMLRDTALEVSLLAQGATTTSVPQLRERCQQLVRDFEKALESRRIPADVREDAVYAQCGLLDEFALTYLPIDKRYEWDSNPLQVERFSNHDAGERIYQRLSARMLEPHANIELLECYSTILGLGFRGRYARAGEPQRAAIVVALNERLASTRVPHEGFIVDSTRPPRFAWLRQLSPWAIAAIACAAAALIWIAWGQSLDEQLAQLLRAKA
ncbi:DotU family type IV/VI secretion system protein [Stenotrophobium rhamnosiphilum]|uniref:Type IV secretion protein DotU n=1 Tax=Stenotrophobium rhamnosiphilum TaxID=2029166 RepID=A0A2T5MJZ4_9GAMM|nr:DotU family type IV/VI secretion system protein [Stenotrophobium rhamnosiphilum]PTU32890.1 type IV secretion protein DotU [Stenotrophobium rhamnosiphilum]